MAFRTQPTILRKCLLFLIALFFCFFSTWAQEKCGTVSHTKHLINKNLILNNNDEQFERWIKEKLQTRKLNTNNRIQSTSYKIPVVVHVIHNGEAIGIGKNISDEQVFSQMAVLNKDFQRLNADAVNTPQEFQGVAGALNIEFVLAKQDLNGLPTNGIVRVKGTKTSWTMGNEEIFKGLSYWPAEDYFNIWVCNLTDYLGYTQFPDYPLPGIVQVNNRLTDGVVVNYECFGTIDAGNFKLKKQYNRGRTLTHETGHFFGLRHIWGDDDGACGGDGDYVDDTPDQGDSTGGGGCTNPKISCGLHKMFQNYMDYSNDVCMNIYTIGQVSRMKIILNNESPRRRSLLTSHGLLDPAPVANDLKIEKIITPRSSICNCNLSPAIEVTNFGTNAITSTRINLAIDSTFNETKSFTLNLAPLEKTTLYFTPHALSIGASTFVFNILTTNGGKDGNLTNNTYAIRTEVTNPYFLYYEANGNDDFYLKFNLVEKQNVSLNIIDVVGKIVFSSTLMNVLNETYPIKLPDEISSGVYIIRLNTAQLNDAKRIFLRR